MLYAIAAVMLAAHIPSAHDTLAVSMVASSVKRVLSEKELAIPVTTLTMKEIEAAALSSPKDLSGLVPGLMIPDYGSSMTSTIYLRGIGSRMENPVIGLYVDDVPVIDKNNYDFSFLDIRRVDMYRGPQGTLYGRNSMLGVLSVETLSPKAWQGIRASLEYGSASAFAARASVYQKNLGVAAMYRHSAGFYTNEYDGRSCDPLDAAALRVRYACKLKNADVDNILSVSYTDEGGYPYRLWTAGKPENVQAKAVAGGWLSPVSYNDKSAYRRLSIMDGFRVNASVHGWRLSSVTSMQMLFDKMVMDQDFTPASMFTLQQRQRQCALTQEVVLKPSGKVKWWDSQSGVFAFAKHNGMYAPVEFLADGIRTLILDNANSHIPQDFGSLSLKEDKFLIPSDFSLWTINAAVYHESYFTLGRWLLTAGLRLDGEMDSMDYDSRSDIHFKLTRMPSYLDLHTEYSGRESNGFVRLLPKVSAVFDASTAKMRRKGVMLKLVASASRGYKSGGFNTQIFSDILQNKMMNGMMDRLGVYLDSAGETEASATSYKPESCMDYEAGARFSIGGARHVVEALATAYYIDCRNQQITVFPFGNGTGRMMANAGRSRSLGVEMEAMWKWKGLNVNASASFMNARFAEYYDGREDYSGNRIPYSPSSTLYMRASYRFPVNSRMLSAVMLSADVSRTGSIAWNETGDMSQPAYALLGAEVRCLFKGIDLFIRGDNLTGTDYCTFYFKSVGNSFFQAGKPGRWNAGVAMDF